ncbi:MAG: carbohydrate kinase [Planctomycetia bacterium]|nr:carbohydrate kinase [Planctomycetia bacterium]
MLDSAALRRIFDSLPRIRIALVGDLFLDKYLDLDSRLTEVSVETGLDAYQIAKIRCYPGAGGTVLNNLSALGIGKLHAISVIGDDGDGFELLRTLRERGIDGEGVIVREDRMTPTYTKPMLSQPTGPARELNRLDVKNRTPASHEQDRQVIARLDDISSRVDAVIVADQVTEQNQGVITDAVRDRLAELARQHPNVTFFADSRSHLGLFRNILAKPNRSEMLSALGLSADVRESSAAGALEEVRRLAGELSRQIGGPVYATIGPDGILYADGQSAQHIPGIRVEGPIDIVGAGDSTTAGIVSALAAGATPAQAAHLGCLVASITIQQIGVTGTASPAQVIERFRESQP